MSKNPEAAKKRLKSRRELSAWFQKYKRRFKCQECGEPDSATLEFHHTDPAKKILAIADLISKGFSKELIMREIEKCDVFCCNCHRKFHYKGRRKLKADKCS